MYIPCIYSASFLFLYVPWKLLEHKRNWNSFSSYMHIRWNYTVHFSSVCFWVHLNHFWMNPLSKTNNEKIVAFVLVKWLYASYMYIAHKRTKHCHLSQKFLLWLAYTHVTKINCFIYSASEWNHKARQTIYVYGHSFWESGLSTFDISHFTSIAYKVKFRINR